MRTPSCNTSISPNRINHHHYHQSYDHKIRLQIYLSKIYILCILVFITQSTNNVTSFIYPQWSNRLSLHHHTKNNKIVQLLLDSSSSSLQMASRKFNSSSKNTNNKKRTNNNKKSNNSKISSNKSKNSNTKKNNNNNNNNSNQHLPPWKIMSTKDVKQNIESEKQRRESIRSGELASSVTSLVDKIGDVAASSSLLTSTDRKLLNWKPFSPDKDVVGMKFEGAYLGKDFIPSLGCPEVAFLGRSNVGKSSLLNKLVKRVSDGGSSPDGTSSNDSARVGKTPGATASVNIYSILGKSKTRPILGLADLPGFGYAKLSKDVKESVELAAERYLGNRRELALGILLVDVRRIPSEDDRAVLAALYDMGVPILVIATKVDKIRSKLALEDSLEEVRNGLGLPEGQPFYVSSMTGEGVKQLWGIIMDACEDKVLELREDMEGGSKENGNEIDPDETIMLDDEGNWIEEEETVAEGLEWVQNFAYYDDSKERNKGKYQPSEESIMKMKQNEARQAAENDAMKVKNLKKMVRKLERRGEV